MEFNNELQRLRKLKGLSQEELGEQLGVSRQTISKWEKGSAYPDMLNLMTISEFFGVTADELINGEKPEEEEAHGPEKTEEVTAPAGSVQPSQFHCEYRSRIEIHGLPLVHINYGFGDYRARGVLAIGNISSGVLSIGILAKGVISVGIISLGLLAIGILSLACFAVGCVAAGVISVAGIALGVMTLGGLALGIVSIGGCAVGTHVSVGGVAIAPIAVGFIVNGDDTVVLQNLQDISRVTAGEIQRMIELRFPGMPGILREWATLLFM